MTFLPVQSARKFAPWKGNYPLQKTVLFASREGELPSRLRLAIEREYEWAVIVEVPNVRSACASFRDAVAIMLVDTLLVEDVEHCASDLRRYHPLAPILLLDRTGQAPPALPPELLNSTIAKGIISLNMPTDLMISVMTVMLLGGEYFPRKRMKAAPTLEAQSAANSTVLTERQHSSRSSAISTLTRREHEIMHIVAKGLQNKEIAEVLQISEHTVKIHIHNIISKLGANNRTQAADMFRADLMVSPARH
ncbi:response regulator transcription factor [Pelagibacterium sp. H642]|uniref:helix-turn-helix transcriptional regulator n=1 Tax=Pelagibacterium sp. H642 TaxID=1881069 RepID=UPI0028161BFB|nr:response regulator transcription factor [Pelagibacterium sp. H642]WMT92825.1 response regulator transcription factor [Pelagibacterium sp. H642]